MATKTKVARSRKPAKSAKESFVRIRQSEIQRCRALIARAQQEAIMAVPRSVPRIGWGAAAALKAFETLWIADGILGEAEVQS